MDQERFDRLTRTLASGQSRRGVLKGLAGTAIGGVLASVGIAEASAKGPCKAPNFSCGKGKTAECCTSGQVCTGAGICVTPDPCANVTCAPATNECFIAGTCSSSGGVATCSSQTPNTDASCDSGRGTCNASGTCDITPDPCANVTCTANGVCINGRCFDSYPCPGQYGTTMEGVNVCLCSGVSDSQCMSTSECWSGGVCLNFGSTGYCAWGCADV